MARIHSHRKGKSHSSRPPTIRSTQWIKYDKKEIESLIVKLAKEGYSPSMIGIKMRDEYGIPLVKPLIGKSVLDVLKEHNLAPEIPEDLNNLLKKAKRLQEHLKKHRSDKKNIHSLELLEAKIHRLVKYYKRKGILPKDWKYTAVVAQLA